MRKANKMQVSTGEHDSQPEIRALNELHAAMLEQQNDRLNREVLQLSRELAMAQETMAERQAAIRNLEQVNEKLSSDLEWCLSCEARKIGNRALACGRLRRWLVWFVLGPGTLFDRRVENFSAEELLREC